MQVLSVCLADGRVSQVVAVLKERERLQFSL